MAGGANAYHDEDAGSGLITGINVTPLVDITLVLLIIFMVTARLISARAIPVDSPKTVTGIDVQSPVEITIKPGGEIYLNGRRVTDPSHVTEAVRELVARDPDMRPIIAADRNVPHGEVMQAIDLIKLGGVKRFAFKSEARPTQ